MIQSSADISRRGEARTSAWAAPAPASSYIPSIHGGHARGYDPMDGGGRAMLGAKAENNALG